MCYSAKHALLLNLGITNSSSHLLSLMHNTKYNIHGKLSHHHIENHDKKWLLWPNILMQRLVSMDWCNPEPYDQFLFLHNQCPVFQTLTRNDRGNQIKQRRWEWPLVDHAVGVCLTSLYPGHPNVLSGLLNKCYHLINLHCASKLKQFLFKLTPTKRTGLVPESILFSQTKTSV